MDQSTGGQLPDRVGVRLRDVETLLLPGGQEAVSAFERRYPRSAARICARVRDYPATILLESEDDGDSEDEVNLRVHCDEPASSSDSD